MPKARRFLLLPIALGILLSGCGRNKDREVAAEPIRWSYTAQYCPAEELPYMISPLCSSGAGFYAYGQECVGEDIPEDVIRQAEEDDEEPENDGRWNVYEPRLCRVNFDGSVDVLTDYAPVAVPDSAVSWKISGFSDTVEGLCVSPETGLLYVLEHVSLSGSSAPEDPAAIEPGKDYHEFAHLWYLRTLKPNGAELHTAQLPLPDPSARFTGAGMTESGGSIWILTRFGASGSGVSGFLPNGEPVRSRASELNFVKMIESGGIALVTGEAEGMAVYRMEDDSASVSRLAVLPDAVQVWSGDGEYDLYYSTPTAFYGFRLGLGASLLFRWSAVNASPGALASEILTEEGGTLRFLTADSRLACITRKLQEEDPAETVLKLCCPNPEGELTEAVARFNEETGNIRVELSDCPEDEADLFFADAVQLESLADAGRLADIYPLLNSDGELKTEDFFPNVLSAAEREGKLLSVCAGFIMDTVIADSELTGPTPGWTYEDYFAALAAGGKDCTGFDVFTTAEDVLREVLAMDLSYYVNQPGEISPGFDRLMQFAGAFPRSFDYEHHGWSDNDSSDLRIRNGQQLLQRLTIYGFDDYYYAGYEFEGDICFIGYPTDFGTGNMLRPCTFSTGGSLALSASCEHPREAWQFLRQFFREDWQQSLRIFPCSRAVFEKKLSEAMVTVPILDKKGRQLYDKDGNPRIYSLGSMYLSDFTEVKYYPLTEEKADQLRNLVETSEKSPRYREDLFRIARSCLNDADPSSARQKLEEYFRMAS